MESLRSMVKEVEIQEKAAEHAKKEALTGGLDVLSKVDDLRQMLQHAKKTNEMVVYLWFCRYFLDCNEKDSWIKFLIWWQHAGEVYGEKSILATEAWELQSRILKLSDQGDESLLSMDEVLDYKHLVISDFIFIILQNFAVLLYSLYAFCVFSNYNRSPPPPTSHSQRYEKKKCYAQNWMIFNVIEICIK